MIRFWVAIAFFLYVLGAPGHAAINALVLTDEPLLDLEGALSLWRDPSKAASLEDALAAQGRGAFKAIPGNLGIGYVPEAAWLAFTVAVPEGQTQERWLELAPPYIDRFDVFRFAPDGSLDVRTGGDTFPLSQRALPYRNPVFRLALGRGSTASWCGWRPRGWLPPW